MFRNIALHRFARGTTGEAKVSSRIHFAGLLLVRFRMGYGLVTDDRSREEGRHYTDQCGARLHARGASDETRVLR
jgi:hypothetical protein